MIKHEKRVHELSALERIIENYSEKARNYFLKTDEIEVLPEDVRKTRQQELNRALKHLEHERRLAEVSVEVQTKLEDYRQEGRNLSKTRNGVNQMMVEEHHPTNELEKNMRAVPIPKPSSDHAAHHIVPGKGKTVAANQARLRLAEYGIRINDPDNGVWLPMYAKYTPHWSMPNSLGHLKYHTKNYETWVSRAVRAGLSEQRIRQNLVMLGTHLQNGTFPKEIIQPPKS